MTTKDIPLFVGIYVDRELSLSTALHAYKRVFERKYNIYGDLYEEELKDDVCTVKATGYDCNGCVLNMIEYTIVAKYKPEELEEE